MKHYPCTLSLIALQLIAAALLSADDVHTMERIAVSPDGTGFVHAESLTSFVPWGVNYGHDGMLIEDFWEDDWSILEEDFREIAGMGGNVARVHLQFCKFMNSPTEPNERAFELLGRLMELGEETGVYLDLTGLASYRPGDRAVWYDELSEEERWAAQAVFWKTVARTCADSPALFCYDLMNEPLSPADTRESWYSGHLFGGLDFLQMIAVEPAGRTRMEIVTAWIDTLTAAIREEDPTGMVTVGMLPWVTNWGHLSGFIPEEVAPHVDFLCVHIYPKTDVPEEAMQSLTVCDVGKPVVIEETFPLNCGVEQFREFLIDSRPIADGWVFHYDGQTPEEIDDLQAAGELTIAKSIWREGLRVLVEMRETLTAPLNEE